MDRDCRSDAESCDEKECVRSEDRKSTRERVENSKDVEVPAAADEGNVLSCESKERRGGDADRDVDANKTDEDGKGATAEAAEAGKEVFGRGCIARV